MSLLLLLSFGACPHIIDGGFLFFSNSFLVEVKASCENTGRLASRDASCVNSTKFAKEYSPHFASNFFALSLHLLP